MTVLTTFMAERSIAIADMKMVDSELIIKYVSTLTLSWLAANTNTLASLFKAECMSQSSDLRSLQFIRSVDGLINEETIKPVETLLGGWGFQSYGTDEACGLVTNNVANENFIGTFGKAVDMIEICIFDKK